MSLRDKLREPICTPFLPLFTIKGMNILRGTRLGSPLHPFHGALSFPAACFSHPPTIRPHSSTARALKANCAALRRWRKGGIERDLRLRFVVRRCCAAFR